MIVSRILHISISNRIILILSCLTKLCLSVKPESRIKWKASVPSTKPKTAWMRRINIKITFNCYFLVLNYFEKTKIWLHHLSFFETKQGTKASAGMLFSIRHITLVFWFPRCESNLKIHLEYIHIWTFQLKDDWYTNDAIFVRWLLDF